MNRTFAWLLILATTTFTLIQGCSVEPEQDDTASNISQQAQLLQQAQASGASGRALKKLYLKLAFDNLCPPVPAPSSWGVDDEAGNTNTQGAGTVCRAGIVQSLMSTGKSYKLSQVFTETSPRSAFAGPFNVSPIPTFCLDDLPTIFCGHSENVDGEMGGQGTQLDFFGHAGRRPTPSSPPSSAVFYNGFTASEVFDGALSAPSIKPINTIGILLDAVAHNGGQPLGPLDVITKQDIQEMLVAQDLAWLGIQPGMAVFIYTGKGDTWGSDPYYYYSGPGLRVEVVEDIYKPKKVVLHGLDNPFSDQADLGTFTFLSGNDPTDPFPIHTHTLPGGILQIQNLRLTELAADGVYLFALQMAPPQLDKAKGAMVTPQAFGSTW